MAVRRYHTSPSAHALEDNKWQTRTLLCATAWQAGQREAAAVGGGLTTLNSGWPLTQINLAVPSVHVGATSYTLRIRADHW